MWVEQPSISHKQVFLKPLGFQSGKNNSALHVKWTFSVGEEAQHQWDFRVGGATHHHVNHFMDHCQINVGGATQHHIYTGFPTNGILVWAEQLSTSHKSLYGPMPIQCGRSNSAPHINRFSDQWDFKVGGPTRHFPHK